MQFSRLTTTPAVPTNGAAGSTSGCKTAASDLISRQFPAVLPRTSTRPSVPRPSPLQDSTPHPTSDASSSSGSAPYAGSAPSPSQCAPPPIQAPGSVALRHPAPLDANSNSPGPLHKPGFQPKFLPPHRRTGTPPAAPSRRLPATPAAAPSAAHARLTRTVSSDSSPPAPSTPTTGGSCPIPRQPRSQDRDKHQLPMHDHRRPLDPCWPPPSR